MARLLIAFEADVNHIALGNVTALHQAVAREHIGVVRLLLEAAANVSVATKWGETALTLAAVSDELDILELILASEPAGISPLRIQQLLGVALRSGRACGIRLVVLLVAMGAEPQGFLDMGKTWMLEGTPDVVACKVSMRFASTLKQPLSCVPFRSQALQRGKHMRLAVPALKRQKEELVQEVLGEHGLRAEARALVVEFAHESELFGAMKELGAFADVEE